MSKKLCQEHEPNHGLSQHCEVDTLLSSCHRQALGEATGPINSARLPVGTCGGKPGPRVSLTRLRPGGGACKRK